MEEREAYLMWSMCYGIGPSRIMQLKGKFGGLSEAWNQFGKENQKLKWNENLVDKVLSFRKNFVIKNYLNKLKSEDIDYLAWCDDEYPEKLKKISHAPSVLYYRKGKDNWLDLWKMPWLGVVGTRKITAYGVGVTKMLVEGVVNQGVGIVSGLMYGVDEIGHRACIDVGGTTIGVWAGGLDTLNVGGRSALARAVYDSGGALVSPYRVGFLPSAATFPARNEWVAGLCDALLVVEGSDKSGTLITAGFAAELDRPVLVVPGPITSSQSAAPITLLKAGAIPVSSVEDVLACLPIKAISIKKKNKLQLGADEEKILEILGQGQMSGDEIARKLNMKMASLMELLTILELSGVLVRSGENWVVRI